MNALYKLILEKNDVLVAAGNFTTAILMTILCAVCVYQVWFRDKWKETTLRIMLMGVAVESFGWAVHRTYYGVWRYFRDSEITHWNDWFIQNSWVALIPQTLILFGLVLMLSPLVSRVTHTKGFLWPSLGVITLYWSIFLWIDITNKPPVIPVLEPLQQLYKAPNE